MCLITFIQQNLIFYTHTLLETSDIMFISANDKILVIKLLLTKVQIYIIVIYDIIIHKTNVIIVIVISSYTINSQTKSKIIIITTLNIS